MPDAAHNFRPLSKTEYESAVAQLKSQHPWLANQVVQPAPGHLGVLTHFIKQFECLLRRSDYRRNPLFCATHPREKLSVRVEVSGATIERERALLDVMDQARLIAQQHCPVCGAPVAGGDSNAPAGVRCAKHSGVPGLFAEDIRRFRRTTRSAAKTELAHTKSDGQQVTEEETKSADRSDEIAALMGKPSTCPKIVFLRPDALRHFVDRHQGKSEEKYRRAQTIAERIRMAGHDRRQLGMLPDDWDALVEEFATNFPNFGALAEVLHDHFALHALGDGRVSWPPMLLAGPPGIGKTEAARWLANRLALPFKVFDMASAQSGAPLAGSEAFWANSEPGQLFELLAFQPKANPVVVLDELDKADQSRQYDPLAALYTLLEPQSARTFVDLSIKDFAVDASHINWVATANHVDSIPAPILSRFTVMNIAAPTPEQVAHIAQRIYGRLRAEASWGSAFDPYLPPEVLDRLKQLAPRALGIVLRRAFGSAARAERAALTPEDLHVPSMPSQRPIGFV